MFQKAKLEFAKYRTTIYLHTIYIVLGIISNLEMIESIWEDVCRFCANAMPHYIRDLSVL